MKRNIYFVLACLSFILLYGTVGSMELEQITMKQGLIQCVVFLALWIFFTYRVRLFYWQGGDHGG